MLYYVCICCVVCCVQLQQYISDTGGVLGLWFGFAFMTFVEFFECFADIIVLMISKLFGSLQSLCRKPQSAAE